MAMKPLWNTDGERHKHNKKAIRLAGCYEMGNLLPLMCPFMPDIHFISCNEQARKITNKQYIFWVNLKSYKRVLTLWDISRHTKKPLWNDIWLYIYMRVFHTLFHIQVAACAVIAFKENKFEVLTTTNPLIST